MTKAKKTKQKKLSFYSLFSSDSGANFVSKKFKISLMSVSFFLLFSSFLIRFARCL